MLSETHLKPISTSPQNANKELSVSSLPQVVPYLRDWLAPCKRSDQALCRSQPHEKILCSSRALAEQFEPLWHLQHVLLCSPADNRITDSCWIGLFFSNREHIVIFVKSLI